MDNPEIARTLEEVADILEIQNANPFRVRAYRNAVRTVETVTVPLRRWVEENRALTDLPGIGKEMANHIKEMVETGTLGFRDELLAEVPRSLIELMRLPGLGPKKARRVWDELAIGSVDELEAAAKEGRVASLPGFGAKSQEKILAGIADYRQQGSRILLNEAERSVEPLLAYLREIPEVERLEVAGSYRRRQETVGDVDLLAIASQPVPVMEAFRAYAQVDKVLMAGDTRSTVVLGSGLQVDLRVVPAECYGAALVYFTGSKEHNVKLRRRAVERGLRISEYGVFEVPEGVEGEGDCIGGREEAEVYATVGLAWIPPELREDHGEIEARGGRPAPPPDPGGGPARRPPHALDVVRRPQLDRGDGRGLRRPRLRVHGDLRPQQVAGDDRRPRRLPPARAVEGDRRGAGAPPRDPRPALDGGGHPRRRLARPGGRDARRARPGAGLPPLPPRPAARRNRPSGCCGPWSTRR